MSDDPNYKKEKLKLAILLIGGILAIGAIEFLIKTLISN